MSQTKAQLIDPVDGTIVNADINASAAIAGTKISPDFGSQAVSTTGGLSINGATVFNESGADVDFRIEGDTDTNLFYLDASENRVGFSTNSPSAVVSIQGNGGLLSLFKDSDSNNNGIIFQDSSKNNHAAVWHYGSDDALVFWSGGSTERMRIDSSGRVQIGTTTAGEGTADDLTIANSSHAGMTIRSGTTAECNIFFADGTTGNARFRGMVRYFHNSDALAFNTSATERMRIDSSGNLGIGTDSPSSNLHVESSSPAVRLSDSDNSSAFCLFDGNGANLNIHADKGNNVSSSTMGFGIDNSIKMTLNSSGFLGVGTNAPDVKLDVARLGNPWTGQDPVAGTVAHLHNGNNGSSSPAYLGLGGGTASISGINFADADDADVGRILYSHSDNSLRFNTNTAERMRIDSSGRVQIGTTTPGESTADDLTIATDSNAGITIKSATNGEGNIFFADGTSGNAQYRGIFRYSHNNDFMQFNTAASERMRITSSGSIGIGTTSPVGRFHVVSGGTTDDAHVTLHASATTGTDNDGEVLKVISSRGTGNNNAIFNVLTNTSTSVFAVTGAGNVGIGDPTPDTNFKLDCTGAARFGNTTDGIIIENSTQNPNTANACRIHRNGSTGELNLTSGTTTARSMIFRTLTSGGESMRLTSGGSLGIGLTAPHRPLHQHVASSSSNYHQFTNSTTGSGATDGGLVGLDSAENLLLWNLENNAVKFGSNNTERARITNDGKFLMGNTGSLDMGFGPQVLSIRGGNSAGYDGTAAAIFGQMDNDAATCIFYNSATNNGTNMLDTRCARGGHSGYSFAIYRSNSAGDTEFRLRGDGNAYADGSWNGGGADYAEYFEWADGNSSEEDRRGYTVVLDGNKIRKSTTSDSAATIIGVISGNPSIVGDNDIDNWKQKYQKDDYGSYILDSDGERILNSDWDETKEYVSREDRKEWSIVGLMGKIRIRKGQTMGTNWIKMQDISATVEEWLVR